MKFRDGALFAVLLVNLPGCGESRKQAGAPGSAATGAGATGGSGGEGGGSGGSPATAGRGGSDVGGAAMASDAGAAGADGGMGGSREPGAAGSPEAGSAGATAANSGGSSNGGRGGAGGSSGHGGADLGESGSGGGLAPLELHAPDSAAACHPAVCHVVQDSEALEAEVYGLDFSVATSSDTTYLALGSEGGANDFYDRFVALGADGLPIPGPDPHVATGLSFVAVDAAGTPHVAGTVSIIDNDNRTIEEATWNGKAWATSAVSSETFYAQAYGFEIGRQDTPTMFWRNSEQAFFVSTEGAVDSWHDTALFGEADAYALDAQGRPTLFSGGSTSYGAFDTDGNALFQVNATGVPPYGDVVVRPAPAVPQALAADLPDMAVAALTTDGLHVAFASRDSSAVTDVPIPGTALLPTCPRSVARESGTYHGDPCAPPCVVQGVGLFASYAGYAFALARTVDGAGWLSYVTQDLDGQADYKLHCGLAGNVYDCTNATCETTGVAGASMWTLHVVRVAPDGTAQVEALTAPLTAMPEDYPFVDSRAFGQRVAVAASIETRATPVPGFPTPTGVRVISFETAESNAP